MSDAPLSVCSPVDGSVLKELAVHREAEVCGVLRGTLVVASALTVRCAPVECPSTTLLGGRP